MKNFAKNGLALLFGLFSSLFILLAIVLFFSKTGILLRGNPNPVLFRTYKADPLTGYTLNPKTKLIETDKDGEFELNINKMGFRGPEYDQIKIRNSKNRIMVLGDSFTYGPGVRKTFVDLLQSSLSAIKNQPIIALNFGVPGYGTNNQLGVLQKYGDLIKPQIVILAFYLGNDFKDNMAPIKTIKIIDGYLVFNKLQWAGKSVTLSDEEVKRYINIAKKYNLSYYSLNQMIRVDSFGQHMTFFERTFRQFAINFPGLAKFAVAFFRERIPKIIMYKAKVTNPKYYEISKEEIETTQKILQQVANKCIELNSTFIITFIPNRYSDDDENLIARNSIKEISRRLGIQNTIDLYPFIKENMDKYYLSTNEHLSFSGHRILSKVIVDYIVKKNL